jgi:Domain of unknown function (DUF4145)
MISKSEFCADCPNCNVKSVTFFACHASIPLINEYNNFDISGVCRQCNVQTLFASTARHQIVDNAMQNGIRVSQVIQSSIANGSALNHLIEVSTVKLQKSAFTRSVPEYLPDDITSAYSEALLCISVGCWNATGAMFRKCVDISTREILSRQQTTANEKTTKLNLKRRLEEMFVQNILPDDLRELSDCIREDGNDAVHDHPLGQSECDDLHDFTERFLDRLYSEPKRLEIAKARRDIRRALQP